MREARRYRDHFIAAVAAEGQPANPWRLDRASRVHPAPIRGWREEKRPGPASILGYALAVACLVACLGIQALDGYRGVASRGAEWLLMKGQLTEKASDFINRLPSPF